MLCGTQRGQWAARGVWLGVGLRRKGKRVRTCNPQTLPWLAPPCPPAPLPLEVSSELKGSLSSFFSICCVLTVFWALTQTQHSSENPWGWGGGTHTGCQRKVSARVGLGWCVLGEAGPGIHTHKPAWPCLSFCPTRTGAPHGNTGKQGHHVLITVVRGPSSVTRTCRGVEHAWHHSGKMNESRAKGRS